MRKVKAPAGSPSITEIGKEARRERIKQYILRGMSQAQMCEEEGIGLAQLQNDVRYLKLGNILEDVKESTRLAFSVYSGEIDWAVEEARKLHEERKDEEGKGGRLDCLNFVVRTRKEEMEMAQKLGLLELAAEKHDHEVHVDMGITNPELIKKFGDFLVNQKDS